ncbi:hypothetical protein NQ176_g377 [Zarea fungicola]|uniref:Uncharacterized protein n=1 Tax=Zarea fungicola TaxID=93591 RepID=A0ACC1NYQ3_9HYPO|nr:hypothetical protein NQ176_g377 [Lecanicillium fungicola]
MPSIAKTAVTVAAASAVSLAMETKSTTLPIQTVTCLETATVTLPTVTISDCLPTGTAHSGSGASNYWSPGWGGSPGSGKPDSGRLGSGSPSLGGGSDSQANSGNTGGHTTENLGNKPLVTVSIATSHGVTRTVLLGLICVIAYGAW